MKTHRIELKFGSGKGRKEGKSSLFCFLGWELETIKEVGELENVLMFPILTAQVYPYMEKDLGLVGRREGEGGESCILWWIEMELFRATVSQSGIP